MDNPNSAPLDDSLKPELLVPLNGWKSIASSTDVLQYADAVYFGIDGKFSMRNRAHNFAPEDLGSLVKKLHQVKIKAYLATNILIYNIELAELYQIIELAQQTEVDAIICHDLAAIMICKQLQMPFHISTQANISNRIAAKYYESLGAERIILARELLLSEIKEISSDVKIPIETFVHGAMCTAISGRCYLSAEIMSNNREFSANRGKCVQPCRRHYTFVGEEDELIDYAPTAGLFFNAKDLCMIEHIPEMIESGIKSFKIEGRMRDPEYIGTVARCYREAIDSYYSNSYTPQKIQRWKDNLAQVFNRGFHTGFFFSTPSPDEISFQTRGNQGEIRRTMIGVVINSYRKAKAVEIEMSLGQIELHDYIVFENTRDFYHKQLIQSLKMDDNSVERTPMASKENHVIVGILTDIQVPHQCKSFPFITT